MFIDIFEMLLLVKASPVARTFESTRQICSSSDERRCHHWTSACKSVSYLFNFLMKRRQHYLYSYWVKEILS